MKEKKKLSLPAWIFIGMLAGIAAGLIFAFAGLGDFTTEWIKPIGTIYVNLLKFLVVPVVLFSIADGVISLKDLKRVGSVGLKTFVYYMITTALAVVIGLVLVNLFKGSFTPLPSADLGALEYEAKEAPSVMQVIVNIFPSNLLQPMVTSDMLPVIVTAIFLGAGVLAAGEKGQKIAELINCMEEVIMKIMMMIIKFTPIGVFCLMANVVAVNGADINGKAGADFVPQGGVDDDEVIGLLYQRSSGAADAGDGGHRPVFRHREHGLQGSEEAAGSGY